ncbi:MAG: ChbG/HpnK family deacetylase [Armatimonadetes bacterium]|nr:ChbG/HpnK family deacetylase [Armatimonadota bacterium]
MALYDAGVLTAASLMVAGPAAADACRCARARPGLAVGLHLALVYGPALLPSDQIPHLLRGQPELDRNFSRAGFRYTLLPGCRRELDRELVAQFCRFDELGLGWSHVDTHLHFSLTPVVFHRMIRECRRYPVAGIRIPEDDYRLYQRQEPVDALRQLPLGGGFAGLCTYQRRFLRGSAWVTTRRCFGLFRTGRLTGSYLARLVRSLTPGDYELHCHPDASTESGRGESRALLSSEFRDALEERQVALVTYPKLKAIYQGRGPSPAPE